MIFNETKFHTETKLSFLETQLIEKHYWQLGTAAICLPTFSNPWQRLPP